MLFWVSVVRFLLPTSAVIRPTSRAALKYFAAALFMPFFYFEFERVGLCALSSYIPVKVAPSQNTFFPIIADSQERDVAFVWLSFSGSLSITILNQRSQASLHPPCAQPLQYKHASRIFYLYFGGFLS